MLFLIFLKFVYLVHRVSNVIIERLDVSGSESVARAAIVLARGDVDRSKCRASLNLLVACENEVLGLNDGYDEEQLKIVKEEHTTVNHPDILRDEVAILNGVSVEAFGPYIKAFCGVVTAIALRQTEESYILEWCLPGYPVLMASFYMMCKFQKDPSETG